MGIVQTLRASPIFAKNLLLRKAKVTIAVCAHRGVRARIFNQLKALEACPYLDFEVAIMDGDALIDRSRGRIATDFLLNRTESKCLIFLDDDIVFNPTDIMKIARLSIEKGLDVVGATYVTKDPIDPHFTFRGDDTDSVTFGKDSCVREIVYLSTGCMAIRREVLQAMVDKETVHLCHPDRYKFYPFFMPMEYKLPNGKWTYLSEDWSFCQRSRDLGFKIWLDCTTKLGHIGDYTYDWDDISRPKKDSRERLEVNYQVNVE